MASAEDSNGNMALPERAGGKRSRPASARYRPGGALGFLKAAMLVLAASAPVAAQDAPGAATASGISLELNRVSDEGSACRATFVAVNRLGSVVDELAYEIVVFDQNGLVDRLVRFDFGTLAVGKTLVKRFDLPGVSCASVGRLLVNDAASCKGAEIEPEACIGKLDATSRTSIIFGR